MTIDRLLKKYQASYQSASFSKEAGILMSHIIKKPHEFVITHLEKKLLKKQIKEIDQLIQRRLKNEPLAYILGYKNFYGLDFIVNKNVLIPRPETELIVDKVLDLLHSMLRNKKIICVDVGTGSGCIITSLAKNIKNKDIKFIGLDNSSKALNIAKKNIINHKLENRIFLKRSNLLNNLFNQNSKFIKNLKLKNKNSNILILANLPYLSEKIYDSTHESVKNYEPEKALVAGKDGLDYYRKLLNQIKILKLENPKIKITAFLEISPEQKGLIKKEIINKFPKAKIKSYKDLAEKWRIIKIIFI